MGLATFERFPDTISDVLNPDNYKTILDLLDKVCSKYAEKVAFSCQGVTLTFGELDRLSRNFAAYLQSDTGLESGDRIAIQMPNLLEYPVVAFGALRAGLIVVNTNPLYTAREIAHQLKDSGAKALVVMAGNLATAQVVLPQTCVQHLLIARGDEIGSECCSNYQEDCSGSAISLTVALALGESRELSVVRIDPQSIALLQYTGGTTGVAKGAMLTHGNLIANLLQINAHMRGSVNEAEEIYIAPLPLYHIYAFTFHLLALFERGTHSVLIPNPSDIESLLVELKRWPFTGFAGINTLFVALCNNEMFRQLNFGPLKVTTSGGMALTQSAVGQWKAITGSSIAEGYGLSETAPAAIVNPPSAIQVGTIGFPVPETEIKVVGENDEELPQGSVGELCIKGPQVMKGYWQRPEESRKVFLPGGWFKTGDMAIVLDDGYIKLVDRKKEMIIVSGFNVYPSEIEDVACLHPDVLESAAIGLPDAKRGEIVRLYVVPKTPSLTGDDVLAFCRKNLTAYKVPKEIVLCGDLPKTNVGKILRRVLREQAL